MLRLQGLRKLSISSIRQVSWNGLYHTRVCWATNEQMGRHPKFNKFPDPRIPSVRVLKSFKFLLFFLSNKNPEISNNW